MTINNTSIRQDVWDTIYTAVHSGIYTTEVTPTVTAAYIDGSHAPFPQIVISPIELDKSDFMLGEDRTVYTRNISINITIYTKKNIDLDVLSDEVDVIMTQNFDGICLTEQNEIAGVIFPNEQKLRLKTLSYDFIRR